MEIFFVVRAYHNILAGLLRKCSATCPDQGLEQEGDTSKNSLRVSLAAWIKCPGSLICPKTAGPFPNLNRNSAGSGGICLPLV